MSSRRLVVVGAGITGLAAAFEWRRRRPDDEIVVLEAGDRIGGKLHRVELAGHWYDTGPEAVLARVPEAVRLVEALGLGDRLVAPATTQASVVLPDGRFPLPAGTVLGVPASAGSTRCRATSTPPCCWPTGRRSTARCAGWWSRAGPPADTSSTWATVCFRRPTPAS